MNTVTFRKSSLFRFITFTVLTAFVGLLPEAPSYAQVAIVMPPPGQMIHITRHFEPPQMVGLKIDIKDPFSFDFIMDQGETPMPDDVKKEEFNKIIKYFLVSLTMPNRDMWVNLSPYESKRIIPEIFAQTEMGRDLLAQDYILKQFTASLMYPENGLGKKFWDKVYQEAQARFGTTEISVNTFNKVWIVADHADVYQKDDTAFLISSHLKVMLEQDYMALSKNKEQFGNTQPIDTDETSDAKTKMASQLVREIIIPAIEKEVNEGKSFAAVRQVYNAEIMATWFKRTLRASLLGQVFANKSKIAGQRVNDPQAMEKIYHQYLRAYKKGVFNYIRDDASPDGQTIPRKYFSGGAVQIPGFESGPVYRQILRPMTDEVVRTWPAEAQAQVGTEVRAFTSAMATSNSENRLELASVLFGSLGGTHIFANPMDAHSTLLAHGATIAAAGAVGLGLMFLYRKWKEQKIKADIRATTVMRDQFRLDISAKERELTAGGQASLDLQQRDRAALEQERSALRDVGDQLRVASVNSASLTSTPATLANSRVLFSIPILNQLTAEGRDQNNPHVQRAIGLLSQWAARVPTFGQRDVNELQNLLDREVEGISYNRPEFVRLSSALAETSPIEPGFFVHALSNLETVNDQLKSNSSALREARQAESKGREDFQRTTNPVAREAVRKRTGEARQRVNHLNQVGARLQAQRDQLETRIIAGWNATGHESNQQEIRILESRIKTYPMEQIGDSHYQGLSRRLASLYNLENNVHQLIVVGHGSPVLASTRSELSKLQGLESEIRSSLAVELARHADQADRDYVTGKAILAMRLGIPYREVKDENTGLKQKVDRVAKNEVWQARQQAQGFDHMAFFEKAIRSNSIVPEINRLQDRVTQLSTVEHNISAIGFFQAQINLEQTEAGRLNSELKERAESTQAQQRQLQNEITAIRTNKGNGGKSEAQQIIDIANEINSRNGITQPNLQESTRTRVERLYNIAKDEETRLNNRGVASVHVFQDLDREYARMAYGEKQQAALPTNSEKRSLREYRDNIQTNMDQLGRAREKLAQTAASVANSKSEVGGINLSDENLTINIKVDGAGMPLSAQYQDKTMLDLNGLTSIIRKITPLTPENAPALYDLLK